MISKELLEILVCPDRRTALEVADQNLVSALNRAVDEGRLRNRAGDRVEKRLDGALVRDDRAAVYPIIDGIPIMLIDEAIPLEQLGDVV